MRMDSISTSNIDNTVAVIDILNEKLLLDFGYELSLRDFDEFYKFCIISTDVDIDSMRHIIKVSTMWETQLIDMVGLIDMAIDQYKNVVEIYEYLDKIAIKNVDEFIKVGPKYRIDTNDIPYAIKDIEQKTKDVQLIIKSLKIVKSRLESYIKFTTNSYYKASNIVRNSQKREKNISFVF